jgi:U3 small nucleolar RNA-associated protein 20
MLLVRLPFDQEELDILKLAFRKAIANIKNSPTITSELSQVCLRYLASIVRHRPEIQVKDNTIGYLLTRILPSLEETSAQGNAFNFVKAVVAQHILIPEVYDIMDNISKIMVVNHHRDVRNMARSVYLLFLMEYDQGKGKLQKEFKFLVNNLGYPTEEGRQSVMELLNSIVIKAGTVLIDSVASSFFVVLSNVTINDESRLCREMAASILKNLFGKASKETLQTLETYCSAWMSQKSNTMLLRCGLNIYNIYIDEFGFNFNAKLDNLAIANIDKLLKEGENKEGVSTQQAEWDDIYSLLISFSSIAQSNSKGILTKRFMGLWKNVFSMLLYPHSWVRLVASRLVGVYLARRDEAEFNLTNYETQTIAYRLLRQLSAPSITEELGEYAMNNLLLITRQWQDNSTPYEIQEERVGETRYALATDFVIARLCGLLRQDANQNDFETSKKISLKLLKVLSEKVSVKYLLKQSETIILALVSLIDLLSTNGSDDSLRYLSQECLEVIENRLGVSDYTAVYARVQNIISQRRQDRKVKRAQTAIIAPDAYAKRKLRKHERFREKRKHEKDENGYYKPKRRRAGV